jgi:hypothetical protein
MSTRFPICQECGQVAGGHMTGCPEDGGSDEAPLVCRSCGMSETEVAGDFVVERAGPICALCVCAEGAK